jgi:hypothetical protein
MKIEFTIFYIMWCLTAVVAVALPVAVIWIAVLILKHFGIL